MARTRKPTRPFPPRRADRPVKQNGLDEAAARALAIRLSGAELHRDAASVRTLFNRKWYVVEAHAGRERPVCNDIRHLGFPVFWPTEIRYLRHLREWHPRPIFPRYLFTAFDTEAEDWWRICRTQGVDQMFMSPALRPIPARDRDIQRLVDHVLDALKAPPPELPTIEAGSSVRLLTGAFAGHEGVVVDGEGQKVRLILKVFGDEIAAEIERAGLEEAD